MLLLFFKWWLFKILKNDIAQPPLFLLLLNLLFLLDLLFFLYLLLVLSLLFLMYL